MESDQRRTRSRKPLSDCTNRISSSQSSSSSSALLRKPGDPLFSVLGATKSAKNDAVPAPHVSVPPPAASSTPSRPPRSSAAPGRGDCEVSEPCSEYSRRLTAEKFKSKVKPSEKPLGKTQDPLLSSAFAKFLSDVGATKSTNNDAISAPHVSVLLPAVSSTSSRPLRLSTASGRGDCVVSEPCSVDSRRPTAEKFKNKGKASKEPLGKTQTAEKRKSKGKAIAEPLSCPPATKIQKIGEKIKEDGSKSLSNAGTVPCKKKQGRLPSRKYSSKNALLQEYIEQQRAYFAEIDAFELPEEEVHSISDLD